MGKKDNDIEYIWKDKKRTFLGLPWSFTTYYLTESKLITRKGFLSVEEDEIELYRVVDKKLVLPLGQRMVGCGSIVMNVRDVDTPVKEIKSVKNPREVLKKLDQHININRDRYRTRGRDLYGYHDSYEQDLEDFD